MFADDTAFVAHYHHQAQEIVKRFAMSAKAYGLKININKNRTDVSVTAVSARRRLKHQYRRHRPQQSKTLLILGLHHYQEQQT